jgi:hypothetical protein
LKGTMIGVAPPSMGSQMGPGGVPAAPPAAAAPPQQAYAPPQPAYEPPPHVASPPSAVNPLGGTVVADTSAFQPHAPGGGGFPQQQPQQPMGGPPPQQGGYGAPPQGAAYGATQAFGAPPPAYGAPPQQQGGYGAPQGYGAAPPGFGAPPDVLGATTPAADGQPMPMQPMAMSPAHDSLAPIPGTVGTANPIVTVLLIVLTCGIYGIYLLVKGKKSASS